ncbi:argininosuccinate lyase [Bosea sp. (in: a-proteobacteria)]|uniref:argininosuccinate lyase n=1 Tax=Bosea sp. (in: a-proteobacteria) TaxID=1871050 RepID=UPI00261D42EF|nr:argininosuccinate lyase [Bosea sp. (in: a-proteobacteria)]MCO5091854.1 argininosuccinate lyase [Bosea sp. (in: a-proteobacteria)]
MQKEDDVFLETARLGKRNSVLIEYDEKPQMPRMRRRYKDFLLVDIAHAVMMHEQGIVPKDDAGKLIGALVSLYDMGRDAFPWAEESGSFLVQVEHALGKLAGKDIAGHLQTARSRNDQSAAAERLYLRNNLLSLETQAVALLRGIVDKAERHVETIMPGYTHFQHAQPWTFGHYLMRQASVVERAMQRLRDTYGRTDLSSLGAAANAGTSWPVDRRRTAALLGHRDIVFNSIDACGFAREFIEENAAAIALLMGNLGRFATDLYIWSSWEFGFVEVHDSLAGTSSIMPQKKNPHCLERVKGVAGQSIGWLPTIMGNMRGTLSTDLDNAYGDDQIGLYMESTFGCLRLMDEAVRTLTVHDQRMAATAGIFWSTTSHLCDELVRGYGINFRQSHQVVASFVRASLAAGLNPSQVRGADLARAAQEEIGMEISLSDADLRSMLDARTFIDTRTSEGSPRPSETRRHIALVRAQIAEHQAWVDATTAHNEAAVADMLATARRYAGI